MMVLYNDVPDKHIIIHIVIIHRRITIRITILYNDVRDKDRTICVYMNMDILLKQYKEDCQSSLYEIMI